MNGIMITLALGTAVGAFVGYLAQRNILSSLFGAVAGIMSTAMVGALVFLMVYAETSKLTESKIEAGHCIEVITEKPIVSLFKDTATSGSFVIGTGSMHSSLHYYSYINTNNGLFLEAYPRNKTYIVEQAGPTKVVTTSYKCVMPLISWARGEETSKVYRNQKHILYVPFGTVLKEFKL